MDSGIEGHKDIVRDVAWHPKRNEILTSSVSFIKKVARERLITKMFFL